MEKIDIKIEHSVGLHARPASLFVQTASKYRSDISITYDGETKNAKSILGVLSLGVGKDSQITIIAEGEDETDAIEALSELIESNFSE